MSPISAFFFFRNCSLAAQSVLISETGPDHVQIRGRRAGILAFLFTHMGLDLTMSLELSESRIELIASSLSGRLHEIIPLTKISSVGVGYSKPVLALVLAFAVLPFGCFMLFHSLPAAFFLLASALALFFFFLFQKTLLIYFTSESGNTAALTFQRSFFESVSVSETDAYRIINILTALLENAAAPAGQRTVRPAVRDPFAAAANSRFPNGTSSGIKTGPHPLAPPSGIQSTAFRSSAGNNLQSETPSGIQTGPHPLTPPSGPPMPPDIPKFQTHFQTPPPIHSQMPPRTHSGTSSHMPELLNPEDSEC